MLVQNHFEKGPDSWCSYDYHGSAVNVRGRVFVLGHWEQEGGLNGGPYVWCEETYWTPDVPEIPLSILPFVHYRGWIGEGPIDLRGREVSVHLRGDGLDLCGGECYFWVVGPGTTRQTRWHFNSRPVNISSGAWSDSPDTFQLADDESTWHRSWTSRGEPPTLEQSLAECESYGFSFVGFNSAVHGKLSMGAFEIR